MTDNMTKQAALNYILESMAEVKSNFEMSDNPENVIANAEAMMKLTESYVKIETVDNLAEITETVKALTNSN